MSNTDTSYQAIPVNGEFLKVRVKRKVPINEIIDFLKSGHEVLVPDMDRKTAYYVKKKLSRILKTEVVCYPGAYEDKTGYAFFIARKASDRRSR